MNASFPPLLVIAGPTASGKSGLALALAARLNGTIINADSMQLYRDLHVLTARPDEAMLGQVPHRLYGALSGDNPASAASWAEMAREAIAEARVQGRLPILVGGTGLYLRVLMQGIASIPPIPDSIRAMGREWVREKGLGALYADLQVRDPLMAARLPPNDTQRILRAWEVITATGQSLASFQSQMPPANSDAFRCLVLMPERTSLYARCNARFVAMTENGALSEVEMLLSRGYDPDLPIMKALGVPELSAYLKGKVALDDAISAAQQSTRRYAKRQGTWFRHQMTGAQQITELPTPRELDLLATTISRG